MQSDLVVTHLNVPIYQPIQLNVIVVLAKWIDKHFGHFQPAHVEHKLRAKRD